MLFNTKVFVVFLLFTLTVYYRLGQQGKLWFLLLMSYVFYGFWSPWMCSLLLLSTLVDFGCARGIEASTSSAQRRFWLGTSLAINLGALFFFKYHNFFLESLEASLATAGLPSDLKAWHLDLVLPVGISFYTFQTLSYTIDVYRRKIPAERSLRDFALYVSFFPQLVAGPVERATHLLPQYKLPFRLTEAQVVEGAYLILLGFVKKSVLGDRLGRWIEPQFAEPPTSGPVALVSLLLFTTQIYVDFSAYSDIAIGLGRLLGYDIRPNFDLPFVVPSIPERWRRWHISMGHWFRDYVYYPLGGSQRGEGRALLNVFLVMFLSGLWHGASANFVVWGSLNGLSMVVHRVIKPLRYQLNAWLERGPVSRWAWFYAASIVTFFQISLINIFFRSPDWEIAKSYVVQIFGRSPLHYARWIQRGADLPEGYSDGLGMLLIVFLLHEAERHLHLKQQILENRGLWATVCTALFVYLLIYGIKGPQFIYYQF